jgi:hypothetical protein
VFHVRLYVHVPCEQPVDVHTYLHVTYMPNVTISYIRKPNVTSARCGHGQYAPYGWVWVCFAVLFVLHIYVIRNKSLPLSTSSFALQRRLFLCVRMFCLPRSAAERYSLMRLPATRFWSAARCGVGSRISVRCRLSPICPISAVAHLSGDWLFIVLAFWPLTRTCVWFGR